MGGASGYQTFPWGCACRERLITLRISKGQIFQTTSSDFNLFVTDYTGDLPLVESVRVAGVDNSLVVLADCGVVTRYVTGIHGAVCNVQYMLCAVFSLRCTVCSVQLMQCAVFSLRCAVCSIKFMRCGVCSLQCAMGVATECP